jgi:hypothetical protein
LTGIEKCPWLIFLTTKKSKYAKILGGRGGSGMRLPPERKARSLGNCGGVQSYHPDLHDITWVFPPPFIH